jgi:hypothetical protein
MKTRPQRSGTHGGSRQSSQNSQNSGENRQQKKPRGKLTDGSAKYLTDDILNDSQREQYGDFSSKLLMWNGGLQEIQEVKGKSGDYDNHKTEEDYKMEEETEDEEMDG